MNRRMATAGGHGAARMTGTDAMTGSAASLLWRGLTAPLSLAVPKQGQRSAELRVWLAHHTARRQCRRIFSAPRFVLDSDTVSGARSGSDMFSIGEFARD